ncbi:unnamed protein product, partial [Phaeothamnion confervicola]
MRGGGGDVIRADVLLEPGGRSKGCGIVEFATAKQAREAIESLTNTELKGRTIFVREDNMSRGRSSAAAAAAAARGDVAPATTGDANGGDGGGAAAAPVAIPAPAPIPAPTAPVPAPMPQPPQGRPAFYSGRGAGVGAAGTRVYVANLAWDTVWQELKDHMKAVGTVVHADVITDARGQSRGCGIVEYDTATSAGRAIRELNNTMLGGRLLLVREDRDRSHRCPPGGGYGGGMTVAMATGAIPGGGGGPTGAGPIRQLFVGNLPYDYTWNQLKDLFKTCGDVQRADIMLDVSKRSKGWGLVRFASANEAANAVVRLHGVSIGGRAIEVREDTK